MHHVDRVSNMVFIMMLSLLLELVGENVSITIRMYVMSALQQHFKCGFLDLWRNVYMKRIKFCFKHKPTNKNKVYNHTVRREDQL